LQRAIADQGNCVQGQEESQNAHPVPSLQRALVPYPKGALCFVRLSECQNAQIQLGHQGRSSSHSGHWSYALLEERCNAREAQLPRGHCRKSDQEGQPAKEVNVTLCVCSSTRAVVLFASREQRVCCARSRHHLVHRARRSAQRRRAQPLLQCRQHLRVSRRLALHH
jgi:hypothetical protein